MMEKMIALQQKRRSKKGGFTLVELIVVLVILAILAALLIPALTGYIDRAKEKSAVAETRQVVMAAQTIADEAYGAKTEVKAADLSKDAVEKLAEVDLDGDDVITVGKSDDGTSGKIVYVLHKSSNGKTCYYKNGEYKTTTVAKPTTEGNIDFGK